MFAWIASLPLLTRVNGRSTRAVSNVLTHGPQPVTWTGDGRPLCTGPDLHEQLGVREFVNKSAASAASLDYLKFQAVIKSAASAASQRPNQGICWLFVLLDMSLTCRNRMACKVFDFFEGRRASRNRPFLAVWAHGKC